MRRIHVWRVPSGERTPVLVAVAELSRGRVQTADRTIQGWLEGGLALLLRGREPPRTDAEDARLVDELCLLRSGSAYLCTPDEDAFSAGGRG